jgi:hypothetical protein
MTSCTDHLWSQKIPFKMQIVNIGEVISVLKIDTILAMFSGTLKLAWRKLGIFLW